MLDYIHKHSTNDVLLSPRQTHYPTEVLVFVLC